MYDPWGGYSVIGFGDIILPGLLIAFSLRYECSLICFKKFENDSYNWINHVGNTYRYDWLSKKNLRAGYFLWAMSAYGLGMNNCKCYVT